MRFDPGTLTRLMDGDETALAERVTFDDGTVKTLAKCTAYDLEVMDAYATFKATEAEVRMREITESRPRHLKAVSAE